MKPNFWFRLSEKLNALTCREYMCKDGSTIVWLDRESVRYTNGAFSLAVWVDFGLGFFSNSRVIKSASIDVWEKHPEGTDPIVGEREKQQVIASIREYFGKRRVDVE